MFSGGTDNAGRMYDLATGQTVQVAQHDAPIKSVKWIDMHGGILATGSWDRTLRVRIFCMHSAHNLMNNIFVHSIVLGPSYASAGGNGSVTGKMLYNGRS